jgi:hypothetical protein
MRLLRFARSDSQWCVMASAAKRLNPFVIASVMKPFTPMCHGERSEAIQC